MKQYLELAQAIKDKGTFKGAAREGMPGTTSLFGYQFRHNLADGFPLLTSKKISWKAVVVELLWFLRGDTNIKFLDEYGVDYMWHEDAYNYYIKIIGTNKDFRKWEKIQPILDVRKYDETEGVTTEVSLAYSYLAFCSIIRTTPREKLPKIDGYTLGDCGNQYGKLWRDWDASGSNIEQVFVVDSKIIPESAPLDFKDLAKMIKQVGFLPMNSYHQPPKVKRNVDQIKDVIETLKSNPLGRRHLITAWDPTRLDDMALNACHALVQFNCRPLSYTERLALNTKENVEKYGKNAFDFLPKYKLDCQMYQRSADVFLGVPYNIASYALLTHILSKICNMIPGDFIHTFGDVHIYENHMDQINEQLTREPKKLPQLTFTEGLDWNDFLSHNFETLIPDYMKLEGYDPHPAIKGKLSTGLK